MNRLTLEQAEQIRSIHGPADVDIRRRDSGEPVVLEVNPRFGAHIAHCPEVLDAMLEDFDVGVLSDTLGM